MIGPQGLGLVLLLFTIGMDFSKNHQMQNPGQRIKTDESSILYHS